MARVSSRTCSFDLAPRGIRLPVFRGIKTKPDKPDEDSFDAIGSAAIDDPAINSVLSAQAVFCHEDGLRADGLCKTLRALPAILRVNNLEPGPGRLCGEFVADEFAERLVIVLVLAFRIHTPDEQRQIVQQRSMKEESAWLHNVVRFDWRVRGRVQSGNG